jgi:hypothetical protein
MEGMDAAPIDTGASLTQDALFTPKYREYTSVSLQILEIDHAVADG